MKIAQLVANLKKLFPDKEKEIDALDLKDEPEIDPKKEPAAPAKSDATIDPSKISGLSPEVKALIEGLTGQLKVVSDELVQMKKSQDDQSKANREREVDAVINQALKDLKLPAENKELIGKYRSLLTADLDAGRAVIESLPKVSKTASSPASRETSNTDKEKHDDQGGGAGSAISGRRAQLQAAEDAFAASMEA